MSLPAFSVRHPLAVSMVFVGILILGIMGLNSLPLELFPNVDLPTVAIFTAYPGAGSFEMESAVTMKVEAAVATVNDVSGMSSQSSEGASLVTVNFNWGATLGTVVADVREKLNSIESELPDGAERPILFKFSASSLPVFTFNIYGDSQDIDYRRMAEEIIKPELEKLSGVAQAEVWGGRKAAVMARISLDELSNAELSLLQVAQAFSRENLNFPAGTLELEDRYLVMRTIGAFEDVEDVGSVLVGQRGGVPLFLRDVAEVSMDFLPQEGSVRAGGRSGVYLAIRKMPGTNTVKTIQAVKDELDRLKALLPPSVEIGIQTDQSVGIIQSIRGLTDAAWQGGILAVLVLLLFLRNIRSTLIVAAVIPLSIFVIFGPMRLMGLSLNFMSLLGISLGVGMLVDNSVVVIESIYRKRLHGLPAAESAVGGAEELASALVGSTLTNVVVFVPLLFVQGIVGALFRDLTFTITVTQIVAMVMAVTALPILSARFLRLPASLRVDKAAAADPHYELSLADVDIVTGKAWFDRPLGLIRRGLGALDAAYERVLAASLRRPAVILGGAAVLLALSVGAVLLVGMEFIPETDDGSFSIQIETAVGSPYSYTETRVERAERIIQGYLGDAVEAMTTQVGAGTGLTEVSSGSNLAAISVTLVQKSRRSLGVWEIVRTLDRRLNAEIPGVKASLTVDSMSSLANTATGSAAPLVFELGGKDLGAMAAWGRRMALAVSGVRGARDVSLGYAEGKPELQVRILREEALSMGLSPYEIAATLRVAYTGAEVGTLQAADGEYPIRVILSDADRGDLERLKDLFFVNAAGGKIALESVAEIEEGFGPLTIERKDRQRVVRVKGFLSGERPLNRVNADAQKAIEALGPPPPGMSLRALGSDKSMNDSFSSLGIVLAISMMLVYMVMAAQFESLLHPLIILLSIPFAAIGMIGMLILTNTTFNLMGFVGAILLVGYVVNTGIVLLDYVRTLRARGMPLLEAVIKGGRTRLKPVIMSAGTTLLGLTPLAIGLGTGSELQAPMGRAVFGGLLSSTIITLVLVPTVYYLIEHAKLRRAAAKAHGGAPGKGPEGEGGNA